MNRPHVGIVLGAGSARGIAHLGVLQVFEEEGLPIDVVVGCSAGAIFGALYATGVDLYITEKLITTYPVIKQLTDLVVPKNGFVKGERILELIRLLTKNMTFEETPKTLAIVATDLEHGKQVVFTEGKIAPAVRASISIPGVFTPYRYQGMVLVDGAVKERLPVRAAKQCGADCVIGVNVKNGREVKINNILDVMMQSVEIMEEEIFNRTALEADILIEPEVGHIGSFKFELAGEAVRLGREAALKSIPEIKRALCL